MKINFHRHHNPGSHDAWKECQFTSGTDLSALTIRSLVTINGQPVLQQHHATYLTGKETSRAHHFAKYLATQALNLDLIKKAEDTQNYTLFNTSLTLPPHPNVEVLQASGLHTHTQSNADAQRNADAN